MEVENGRNGGAWKWSLVITVGMTHDSEHGGSWWSKVHMMGMVENGGQVGHGATVQCAERDGYEGIASRACVI